MARSGRSGDERAQLSERDHPDKLGPLCQLVMTSVPRSATSMKTPNLDGAVPSTHFVSRGVHRATSYGWRLPGRAGSIGAKWRSTRVATSSGGSDPSTSIIGSPSARADAW